MFLIAACNKEELNKEEPTTGDNENEAETSSWGYDGEPATVTMLINVGEEEFSRRYQEQIAEVYPNITLKLISGSPNDSQFLQEQFARGEVPDIIPTIPTLEYIEDLDLLMPIDDMVEQSGFDLGVFREGIIDNLRAIDPLGEGNLYGLPIESTLMVMYYNKDIFDRLGESYPVEGMTWEEALELAKKLTREVDGVQYKGLALEPSYAIPYTQFAIPGTDPETGEVLFTQDPNTKRVFDWLDKLRNIPGLMDMDEARPDGFGGNGQNIAMWISTAPWLPLLAPVEGLDFDMTSVPVWEDMPGIAPTTPAMPFNITKHSENKEAAWAVISHLATEEGQKVLSAAGSAPTYDSEEVFALFGHMDLEDGATYNVQAPFINQMGELPPYSKYGPQVTFHGDNFITAKAREFLESDVDVVTYLRQMEEEYTTIVAEMKAKE
ncbi:hypothetical protein J8TS2_28400 [Lederbergia ruris]|uniref:Extracellular solute-binding protein n=1 Tax=Lederbergia ruris TaxID=217495 RepID=A0ABQ4KKP9_9BACI|nr:extracellular solute-binding protein [Lederbergia ruris]GIN58521.1 hypothetical protein J8TS2_28400 [Lederbergia ruris]